MISDSTQALLIEGHGALERDIQPAPVLAFQVLPDEGGGLSVCRFLQAGQRILLPRMGLSRRPGRGTNVRRTAPVPVGSEFAIL